MHSFSWVAIAALCAAGPLAAEFRISLKPVFSGTAVVTTKVPEDFPAEGELQGSAETVPFQKLAPDEMVFIARNLVAGSESHFTVKPGHPDEGARAKAVSNRVAIELNGLPAFTYQGAETPLPRSDIKAIYQRGGYIHPVLTPRGKVVTDDYPANHLHHHGIWAPWTKTEFEGRSPDFWNMGDAKGRVEFAELVRSWSGPVCAGIIARHRFIDLTSGEPKPVLNETWEIRAFALPHFDRESDYFLFDLVSTQTCATASPLKLPKYLYGGLGFRGNWDWNGEDNCFFLTSNGESDRVKGNETRANWCYISGKVDERVSGIAIFGHPDNFRAPQPMRLHPQEPFFCFAPSQLGDWSIESGKPYVARYRFLVKDGQGVRSALEDQWQKYAQPPEVTVTRQ